MGRENEVNIHPTAIVHPQAQLGKGTRVGAYSIVGEYVETGEGCDIQEHVVLRGRLKLGSEVVVFPHAVLGGSPQHGKYQNEPTSITIGDRTVLRESVTVHLGTPFGNQTTQVGSDCLIMAYTHVAHDCVVGNHVIIANAVQLAGHVHIEDHVNIGGHSAVVQHCRAGRYSYIGGGSVLRKDLLPFMSGKGTEFEVQGVNVVGLKRKGFDSATIGRIREMYKYVYMRNLTAARAVQAIEQDLGVYDEVKAVTDFIKSSKAGLIR